MNASPQTEEDLEIVLSEPDESLVDSLSRLGGDILVLGAGGKMGPSLSVLAKRAIDQAGGPQRVVAVSRFSVESAVRHLQAKGVETVSVDLLERAQLGRLPDCPNVIYLAGMKFGSTGDPGRTWAMNVLLPAMVAERYKDARIVALSTGNVYPFVSPVSGGATEDTAPAPVGEYAWSCLGRERMFQYAADVWRARSVLVRLNYANDLRYGVLQDVARKVHSGEPIDVTMGWFNTVWQGDANAVILRALDHVSCPPLVVNLTGPDIISVRDLACRFGDIFGRRPVIIGEEAPTALLSNAGRCRELFGPPNVSLDTMVEWTAEWVRQGGRSLGKPTHFEARDGRF